MQHQLTHGRVELDAAAAEERAVAGVHRAGGVVHCILRQQRASIQSGRVLQRGGVECQCEGGLYVRQRRLHARVQRTDVPLVVVPSAPSLPATLRRAPPPLARRSNRCTEWPSPSRTLRNSQSVATISDAMSSAPPAWEDE